MKVICRRTAAPDGSPVAPEGYPWLRVGAEYVVLSVEIQPPLSVWVRVLTELDQVALFRLQDFEVSDSSLSSLWILDMVEDYVSLALPNWHETGFWDRVYDNDEGTLAQLAADVADLLDDAGNAANRAG